MDIKHTNEILAQELNTLAAANDGQLVAAHVLDAARDPTSPLHSYFDWDDNSAAEKFRLVQAGMLIRRVKLHIVRSQQTGPNVIEVRAYHSLPTSRTTGDGYTPLVSMLGNDEAMQELYAAALADLEALKAKYANLVEFEAVWRAAETAATQVKRRRRAVAITAPL